MPHVDVAMWQRHVEPRKTVHAHHDIDGSYQEEIGVKAARLLQFVLWRIDDDAGEALVEEEQDREGHREYGSNENHVPV